MMTCFEALEYMSRALDDDLNESEKEQLDRHIAECETCKKEYEDMQIIFGYLKNEKQYELPSLFHEELMSKINNSNVVPFNKNENKKTYFKKYVAIAATMFVFVLVGISSKDMIFKKGNDVDMIASGVSGDTSEFAKESEAATLDDSQAVKEIALEQEEETKKEVEEQTNSSSDTKPKIIEKNTKEQSTNFTNKENQNVKKDTKKDILKEVDTTQIAVASNQTQEPMQNDMGRGAVRAVNEGTVEENNVNHISISVNSEVSFMEEVTALAESLDVVVTNVEDKKYTITGESDDCSKVKAYIVKNATVTTDDEETDMIYSSIELVIE